MAIYSLTHAEDPHNTAYMLRAQHPRSPITVLLILLLPLLGVCFCLLLLLLLLAQFDKSVVSVVGAVSGRIQYAVTPVTRPASTVMGPPNLG
jgi:hypothetical protein